MHASPLKWAGSKRQLVPVLKEKGIKGCRLVEPFVGSATVALNLDFDDYLLADTNTALINFHKSVSGDAFIKTAKMLFVQGYNTSDAYYAIRDEMNQSEDPSRIAELFLYLNRHCFNGLCRFNKSGKFNVSYGKYKSPYYPQIELYYHKQKLRSDYFKRQDFKETFKQLKSGDVVYCDPPYTPISTTANFTNYSAEGFTAQDHLALRDCAIKARSTGCTVMISNHDLPVTRELYRDADEILELEVSRTISRDGNNRNRVSELLAIYFPR